MKVAIIGASGFVGTALLKEAVSRGYDITAIVRHPEKITVKDSKLTVKKGDAMDAQNIAELVKGHDAVISTYNAGWDNPNIYNDFLAGAQAIQEGTKAAGVKRFLFVGGGGSLEVAPGVQLVDTPKFPAEYKAGALAARDYLNILKKEKDLDWTFLSPAILMHQGIKDGRTGKYRLGTDQPVFDEKGESRISAEDLCVALLDELEKGQFIKKRFTVAY
ncbi:NAD(P)-dependent oxidoreductase [Chryseosolibacter indicus]|uniref:NAD(P)-dependent oxidoreductase n=1 Tax=Chryseosolibacter indicus TaxID=2782351 RepID=A0ABS5VQF4_9BACT|nr:NAD(P)-dependent oxidoreductase [Chryseosolibacter indicus]MBT1703238.1 NAD(P)-dependent oxidoreductase [Chryseosolibacter indicus]